MRILYIDIDSCRADHLGCYGYHRNTSPAIDAIAADGIRFNNYYTTDAPCLPSRSALYTGMFGIHSGIVGHGGTAADLRIQGKDRGFRDKIEYESLPTRLQQAGFHTAQISPFGQRHAARHFYAGFNEIHNTGKGGMESAEDVQPVVDKWLQDNGAGDNWFLHINYWDPHTPYRVPRDVPNWFENDPLPDWLTEDVLKEHLKNVGPHSARELQMWTSDVHERFGADKCPHNLGELRDMDDLKVWIDGYDRGVRYVDEQIAKIVKQLKDAGVYDETAIIISADHGENQGELGIYGEHGTADQITCRVPMIVKWPGTAGGRTDDGLHQNIDMAPTFGELLGFDPSPSWDGRSYAKSITGSADTGKPWIVMGQCCHVCQRSVRFGPWLYIRTYHCGGHLFPKEMLFNIDADPHEQHDLAAENRAVCDEALRHLSDWHDEMMATMDYDNDPLWTVIREDGPMHAKPDALAAYAKRLEQTGRSEGAAELRRRYPKAFA